MNNYLTLSCFHVFTMVLSCSNRWNYSPFILWFELKNLIWIKFYDGKCQIFRYLFYTTSDSLTFNWKNNKKRVSKTMFSICFLAMFSKLNTKHYFNHMARRSVSQHKKNMKNIFSIVPRQPSQMKFNRCRDKCFSVFGCSSHLYIVVCFVVVCELVQ